MSPWLLRAADTADAAAMAALIVTAFSRQEVTTDPPPSARRVTPADVAGYLAAGGGLIAEAAAPIGCLIWAVQGDALYLSRLAVHPDWRRRGVAQALLEGVAAAARRVGVSRLTLGTRLALTGNRALFASAGFVEVALETHPGYAAPTAVRMERRLPD